MGDSPQPLPITGADEMLRIFFTFMMTLFLTGCGPRYVDYFPCHDDGTAKPKVALLPIINTVEDCLPWDVANEVNQRLRYQAMCSGELFLLSENEIASRLQGCKPFDYFGSDMSFIDRFCGADYIVALEVIQHQVIPFKKGACAVNIPPQKYRWKSVLQMKLRLKVIDVRYKNPKILMQEIFTSDYAIPVEQECIDYRRCCWGTNAFLSTPWGRAHQIMVEDLVCRIETIIRRP